MSPSICRLVRRLPREMTAIGLPVLVAAALVACPAPSAAQSGEERAGTLMLLLALGARASDSEETAPAPAAGPATTSPVTRSQAATEPPPAGMPGLADPAEDDRLPGADGHPPAR